MATKNGKSSNVDPHHPQCTASVSTTSAISANSPKVSMFGAKSGFVIPKNKLSGSLVPIFRGGGKTETGNLNKEETAKPAQRKTKWGADLTEEASVRKGRALAYQIRVEQITKQLTFRAVEIGDDKDSHTLKQDQACDFSPQVNDESKMSELLELEKREIIGEILQLNPNFKAPADYKPLLKEAKVAVPLKAYPGYNFVGLFLGPESKTQKRLEEETGAKIRVYGIKSDTGEKREITPADVNEAHSAYEELYVNVSADTFEKVDTAVSLIELLLTPVAVNVAVASTDSATADGSSTTIADSSKNTTSVASVPQPMPVPVHSGLGQFQAYSGPWYSVPPPNAPLPSSSGFMLATMPNSSMQLPSSPSTSFSVPPFFGQPPHFGPVSRPPTTVFSRPQSSMQVMQQTPNQGIPPQNQSMHVQLAPPAYSVMPATQPTPIGVAQTMRSPLPVSLQPRAMAPLGLVLNRPMTTHGPSGDSSQWSSSSQFVPQPRMAVSMLQTTSSLAVSSAFISPTTPTNVSSTVPATAPPRNFAPPTNIFPRSSIAPPAFSCISQSSSVSLPAMSAAQVPTPVSGPRSVPPQAPSPVPVQPIPGAAGFPTIPHPVTAQAAPPPQSVAPVMAGPPVQVPSAAPAFVPSPSQLPKASPQLPPHTGSMLSFTPMKPVTAIPITPLPVAAPKPRPSSSDFTFQPLGAQVSVSRPNSPSVTQAIMQSTSLMPSGAPQSPSFRPALPNLGPSVSASGFPGPLAVNQTGPSRGPIQAPLPRVSFTGNRANIQTPPRPPIFQNLHPMVPIASAPRMLPPNFSPARPAPNLPGPMPLRAANMVLPHHAQLPPPNRSTGLSIPNQQQLVNNPFGGAPGKVSPSPEGNQIYDPFSPTSISSAPANQGDGTINVRKPDTDAEYEDLMASVGVR